MRQITSLATAVVVALAAQTLLAQQQPRMKPTVPGTHGDPQWQGILRLSDGRTFVTDGGLAIDAALARPAKLPERELVAKILEDYLNATHKADYGFGDLSADLSGKTYTSPNGIRLNATYINFLRRILPRSARLRMTAAMQPIVIVADGQPVGVLMPVKQ